MYDSDSRNEDNPYDYDNCKNCCKNLGAVWHRREESAVWIQITPDVNPKPTFPANAVIPYGGNEESFSANSCEN